MVGSSSRWLLREVQPAFLVQRCVICWKFCRRLPLQPPRGGSAPAAAVVSLLLMVWPRGWACRALPGAAGLVDTLGSPVLHLVFGAVGRAFDDDCLRMM